MKKIVLTTLSLLCVFALLQTVGCTDPIPETTRVKELLKSGNWIMQSASVNSVDQTTVYTGLTITFTETSFSTTNGAPVWPATGTWTFTDETAKMFSRNDGLIVTIDEITATKLVLKLTWANTTIGSGRVNSVGGQNVFTFGH